MVILVMKVVLANIININYKTKNLTQKGSEVAEIRVLKFPSNLKFLDEYGHVF